MDLCDPDVKQKKKKKKKRKENSERKAGRTVWLFNMNCTASSLTSLRTLL